MDNLVIVLITLSALCILMHDKIGKIIVDIIITPKVYSLISNLFLSKKEKMYFEEADDILISSPNKLKAKANKIIKNYAKVYDFHVSTCDISILPRKIRGFFSKYDYLTLGQNAKNEIVIMNKKLLHVVKCKDETFYVIGADVEEEVFFLVKPASMDESSIYETKLDNIKNNCIDREQDVIKKFHGLENFICYYYFIAKE
ncbi:MAG: hypothetical protein JXR78_19080 [Victivallales bacterium]|nr:hypothetical protein [Victivallales bacterium]